MLVQKAGCCGSLRNQTLARLRREGRRSSHNSGSSSRPLKKRTSEAREESKSKGSECVRRRLFQKIASGRLYRTQRSQEERGQTASSDWCTWEVKGQESLGTETSNPISHCSSRTFFSLPESKESQLTSLGTVNNA